MADLVFPNSRTASEVYRVAKILPLATAREISGVLGKSPQQVQGDLKKLEKAGFVRQDRLGSFTRHGKQAGRWRIKPKALEEAGLTGQTWHDEGNSCQLLFILPMLAQFYQILGQIQNLGKLEEFLWTDGLAMDAAAIFERGWIALYWSGPQETEGEIAGRIDRIISDVGGESNRPARDWPCLLAWVVADEWQHELVDRATRRSGLANCISIWRVSDGNRSGVLAPNPQLGRGRLRQPVRVRGTGGWSWDSRVAASIWSQDNGYANHRMLRLAQNHPGMTLEMGSLDLQEKPTGKSAERTLRQLVRRDLLDCEKDGMHPRYHLDISGVEAMIRLDGATHQDYAGRALSDSWVTRPDRREHHRGALDLMTAFMAGGLTVAPGWRGAVQMGRHAVTPDGLVLPHHSPYGPVFHLVEYERSARGLARATKKLRGFAALRAIGRPNAPLLIVCYDDRAEANFHRAGAGMDVQMLTTTIRRLKEQGPLDCWSMYGEPVRIG